MHGTRNKVVTAVFLGALVIALGGCKKEEGPAEKAGKEIDKAIGSAGAQLESFGKEVRSTLD